MGNITKSTRGSLAKTKKQNEIIQKVNAIENMTVRAATDEEAPRLIVSDNNSELIVPGGGGGGGGGGGLPDGNAGDMLYNDGNGWVVLLAPASGSVLRHNGTIPYWEQPVDVCS